MELTVVGGMIFAGTVKCSTHSMNPKAAVCVTKERRKFSGRCWYVPYPTPSMVGITEVFNGCSLANFTTSCCGASESLGAGVFGFGSFGSGKVIIKFI